MAEVKFKRETADAMQNLPIDDGSFIVEYETPLAYIDVGNQRIQFAGATNVNTTYKESNNETYSTNYINGKIIEESGTNYIKIEDGTLICWDRVQAGTHNFPEAFITSPQVSLTSYSNDGNAHISQYTASSTQITIQAFYCPVNGSMQVDNAVYNAYIAIGKWK